MKMSKIFRGDKTLWVVFFLLSIISLVEVYSSIGYEAYRLESAGGPTGLFLRHLLIVLATWVIVAVCSRINYRFFSRFAVLGLWASIVLLAVTLMMGGRWLRVPLVSQFQPSEVAKIALILFVARMITLKKEQVVAKDTFFSLLAYIALVVALVLPENFSTAALLFLACYLMLFFGGVDRRWWWRTLIVLVAAASIGLYVTYRQYEKKVEEENAKIAQVEKQKPNEQSSTLGLKRASTWGHRFYSWVSDPDPTVVSQENMARMAIARGGLFGVGPGNTIYARLMTQSHNDFIYAIIIEEIGLVGGVLVLLLYSFFYFRCMRLAWRARGRFGALAAAGLGTIIYFQAMANMGVAVGVLPVTGQTLPFISYGGTAYLFLGIGLGIIQSVAADAYSEPEPAPEKEAAPDSVPAPEPTAPVEPDDDGMTITDDTDKN